MPNFRGMNYAAVRAAYDDGHEFVLCNEIDVSMFAIKHKAFKQTERECGRKYVKDNPVVRIIKIKVEEVETMETFHSNKRRV